MILPEVDSGRAHHGVQLQCGVAGSWLLAESHTGSHGEGEDLGCGMVFLSAGLSLLICEMG